MRSTTDVALFLRALLKGMNRPVLAERPRSVNRGFLLAMKTMFPVGAPAERDRRSGRLRVEDRTAPRRRGATRRPGQPMLLPCERHCDVRTSHRVARCSLRPSAAVLLLSLLCQEIDVLVA